VIYCNDNDSLTRVNTNIQVYNNTPETVKVYVYETPDDQVKPDVIPKSGSLEIHRGYSVINPSTNLARIFEVEITVKDASGTDVLSHIVTTRLAK
jgi:hypothetical protein